MTKLSRFLIVAALASTVACVKPYPDMRLTSSVRLSDLDRSLSAAGRDGVQYFDDIMSTGRFPTGVSVVRVTEVIAHPPAMLASGPSPEAKDPAVHEPTADANESAALAELAGFSANERALDYELLPLRSFEATYWTELFDSTPEIREVVVLHDRSVRRELTDLGELVRVSEVMESGLLLIYGFDNTSVVNSCRVEGVVYDVERARVLAHIRHTSTLSDAMAQAQRLSIEERPETKRDWAFYLDQVAFRTFEEQFRKCIWNLIDRDQPADTQVPSPYRLVPAPTGAPQT